ncbi:hypothetical protein BDV98DRAFT_98075 [Pterulicium gracile]|uniref:Uncharacterized protein n=1 Tax=Pterulicium gracile TaxID=1884261 RepID=A0A5C3QHA9_9AGAR|nr:hypothetical protein BDV98DRAFT_98075 [Pterula gracilis]
MPKLDVPPSTPSTDNSDRVTRHSNRNVHILDINTKEGKELRSHGTIGVFHVLAALHGAGVAVLNGKGDISSNIRASFSIGRRSARKKIDGTLSRTPPSRGRITPPRLSAAASRRRRRQYRPSEYLQLLCREFLAQQEGRLSAKGQQAFSQKDRRQHILIALPTSPLRT